MNVVTIRSLVQKKSGHSPVSLDETALRPIRDLLGHPDIDQYVRWCLPQDTYLVSQNQLAVHSLCRIKDEMHPECGPGGFIRPFGYLVVASSAGGNVVCFHSPTGKVFWVDHEAFAPGGISYQDRSTQEWAFVEEYSPENVQRPMVALSDNIEQFLTELFTEQLTNLFAALD